MPFRIDKSCVAEWIHERYAFWKIASPRYAGVSDDFWHHLFKAELVQRLVQLRALREFVDDPPTTRLIDVGIGEGMFPWLLQRLNFRVTGFGWGGEQSQPELEKANPRVDVLSVRYDRERWPLPDASADLVTLWEVLEHVHPPVEHLLSETLRVLKPGGVLLGSTPNVANLRKRLFLLMGKSIHQGLCCEFSNSDALREYYASNPFILHIREFTSDEVRQLLRWAGFKTIRVFSFHQSIYSRIAELSGPLRKGMILLYKFAGDVLGVRDILRLQGRKTAA